MEYSYLRSILLIGILSFLGDLPLEMRAQTLMSFSFVRWLRHPALTRRRVNIFIPQWNGTP